MKKSQKGSLHDHLVKEVYSQPRYSLDILKLVFSAKELGLFDWTSLKTEATTFIDKEWRERRMDLLLSAGLKNSKQRGRILFLMEHKSQYDPELMRQFLMYQAGIYAKTRDPVIPVFINQSPNKVWRGPKDFQGFLKNFDGELKRFFRDNVMNFGPRDLHIQSVDVKKEAKDLTTRPILYILKQIWRLDESKVRELFTISKGLSEQDREALVSRAVDYIRRFDPYFNWNVTIEMEQTIFGKEGKLMSPLLQSSLEEAREEGRKESWQKGIAKGRQEGRQEVALNFLSAGLDLETVSKCTCLSVEEIKKLKNGS